MRKPEGMWIDVVAKAAPKDKVLPAFRKALVKRHQRHSERDWGLITDVELVRLMVGRIINMLRTKRKNYSKWGPIRPQMERLRIFGHGAANMVALSPLGHSVEDLVRTQQPYKVKPIEQPKVIQLQEIKDMTYQQTDTGEMKLIGAKTKYQITNELSLKRLRTWFSPKAWVELHSCRIVGEDGPTFLKELAKLLQVRVAGSPDKQYPGGGLEGTVIVAWPNGKIEHRKPKPKPKGKGKEESEWAIRCNMANRSPLRGSAMIPNVLARGVVSNRKQVLGQPRSEANIG